MTEPATSTLSDALEVLRTVAGPAGLEPGLVDASLPRPVVRVGRQVEVREAHGMGG